MFQKKVSETRFHASRSCSEEHFFGTGFLALFRAVEVSLSSLQILIGDSLGQDWR
jgi:hypothetical protein